MGYFTQNDPFFFSSQLSILFPSSGFKKIVGNIATGDWTVVLDRALLTQLGNAGGKGIVVEKCDLNSIKAASYKKLFDMVSNSGQIPFILGPLSLLPIVGQAITIATSLVDGLNRISATGVSAEQLCILMADGGSFSKILSTATVGGETRLGMTIVYSVSVGREARLYQVYASAHAVASGP